MTESRRELLQRAFRYALALTHDRHRAEDLVQEACLATIRASGPLSERYLLVAVRAKFIDECRRRVPLTTDITGDETPLSAARRNGTVDTSEREETNQALHEALGSLRDAEREVIFLSTGCGFTAEQIGQFTGQPRSTVLSLMQRGKRKLAARLQIGAEAGSDSIEVSP